MKVNKLTPEQEARFPEFIDKWLKIGLCTEPANRPLAEAALVKSYQLAGLKPPSKIVWVTSPLVGVLVVSILKDKKLMKKIMKEANAQLDIPELESGVRSSVGSSVWSSVESSVGSSVESSVESSVRSSVESSVWSSVWSSVRSSVESSVESSVWSSEIYNAMYGQQDASWLAFYDYFREVCGLVKETELLQGLTDLARHSNWVYPYQNIAVMCDKPDLISLKNEVIHNETGPAVRYRDGFAVYGVEGRRLSEWVVMTPADKMTAKEVMALKNVEERLYAIKKFGAGNMLKELNGKSISKKGSEYELFSLTIEGDSNKLLKMQNPSIDHVHYEFVSPECNTVNEALMWRLGMSVKTFREPVAKT